MYRAKECFALVVAAAALAAPAAALAAPPDLSTYVRVGRYNLPATAQEASAVTYDAARGSLFVVGDGATSVLQVSKTGQLIDAMALSGFVDTEGIASLGGGQFIVAEERERRVNRFTYVGGGTLTRDAVQSVKLGTTIGNTGIEGISTDPLSGGLIAVKESGPLGIFATGIDWAAGTATNGSPTTENSTNLFDPALAGVADFSDVFATTDALLVISQESGRILNLTRAGQIASALTIVSDPGNPLSVADQGHEGVTMDADGRLYVVSEAGGGSTAVPQLWVYAPSTAPNQAPTAVTLTNPVASVPVSANRVKVADVSVTDDGVGTNALSVTGAAFEVEAGGLYLKAGTAPGSYTATVAVDDPTVGATPDATSAPLTVTVTAAPAPPSLIVSEVSPWSSGNSPYGADWIELTNTGADALVLTGYRIDDSSNAFANSVALTGVTSVAAGESVIFLEGNAATGDAFKAAWFGGGVPAGLQVGSYSGAGIGLSTDGDAVNVFDGAGNRVTGVTFGASTTYFSFDNAAGLSGAISALSVAGVNGAFVAGGATGSPGAIAAPHDEVSLGAPVTGLVPPQLSLILGGPAVFTPFTAGAARDYLASTTATVTSTAGAAMLTVADAATTAPGHLVNGTFALPQALQINAGGGAYGPVGGTLLTYGGPVSNDEVTIGLKQTIGAKDALRTGSYAKTLTFTLSTTQP